MAETTKRGRSPSPTLEASGNGTKRAKDLEEKALLSEKEAAVPLEASAQGEGEMASEGPSQSDEVDAVDLGVSHEGEELDDGHEEKHGAGADDATQLQGQAGANDSGHAEAEGASASIAIRALIVTGDASIIIGKQGKHINEIRDKSGAKLTIVSSVIALLNIRTVD